MRHVLIDGDTLRLKGILLVGRGEAGVEGPPAWTWGSNVMRVPIFRS